MQPYTFDLQRIFLGDQQPPVFLLEIAFRTSILYLFTLVMLRLVGHRGLGQLSMSEFALIVALGSAVGDPMFYADVPLLHGMTVIFLVIVFQRILNLLARRSRVMEHIIDGYTHRLVMDGCLDLKGISKARLSAGEVFAELRQNGAHHLGQIHRAYLEIDGEVSVFLYKREDIHPGLPLLPLADREAELCKPGRPVKKTTTYACHHCGFTQEYRAGETLRKCRRCGWGEWVEADDDLMVEGAIEGVK
jgi:uncharacterized membrane protein YcaP (DUF421 family)